MERQGATGSSTPIRTGAVVLVVVADGLVGETSTIALAIVAGAVGAAAGIISSRSERASGVIF